MDCLRGITFLNWWRLLLENRFAIDRIYWRRALAVTRISLYNSSVKRKEDKRFGAAIAQATVQPPMFILGHWRTGTTLLHELLALDDQFAYPNLFEVSNPHTFLTHAPLVEKEMADEPPQARPMDNMRVTYRSPGEDEAALSVTSLRSPVIAWAFPRREAYYDRYYTFRGVPQSEVDEWKAAFIWFMRKLSREHERPFVLKSPPHTGRIKLLLELFPEARFIHIQRDPYTVFCSTQNLYTKAVSLSYLQRPTPDQLDNGILRRYADMYAAYFDQRALIPPGHLCEIRFEDLERDVVGQMKRIYESLNLPGFGRLEPKLQRYAQDKGAYQKNTFVPLPEQVRSKVVQAWRPYFESWGYAT